MEIHTVLVTANYQGDHWKRLETALAPSHIIRIDGRDEVELEAAIAKADVAIVRGDLDSRYLNRERLRWVHCDHAGIEKSARPEVFDSGLLVTGSAGRSAPALAEHAMLFMLALCYNFPRFLEAQRQHQWGIEGQNDLRGLIGKTVGILGLGHTGQELATRCKAFGMEVLAWRRKAQPHASVDQLFTAENEQGLDELLKQSDIVVLALPLSDQTWHLLGEREFECMKNTAFLVNMARGNIIDESALLKALEDGEIAGAGLDTFGQEPLHETSLLWDAPNVLITPHVTPQVPDRTGAALDILSENIRRYRADETLVNLLRPEDVYTKGPNK
ncbi:MAG: D-2-hydroxyacid dehydrogenase [Candidatus Latescibacteria bacterium]|jgi:phosphoglycerate dehydrogenase-like enzyme|nr:D-2-hydroxyacid dehydrogenase [Candidatus Latescibacterota bacterium]MBT5828650.1 D-2-hydroxyacid dehydrogenase [Candidatus Latescibacterota bacterium]